MRKQNFTFFNRQEGGTCGVDLKLLEVVDVVAEGFGEQLEFASDGGCAHQAVVGVDGDIETQVVKQVEGVVDHRGAPGCNRTGLQIRRW